MSGSSSTSRTARAVVIARAFYTFFPSGARRSTSGRRSTERQRDREGGALVRDAADGDAAAVQARDLACDPEAQPVAAAPVDADALEALEDALLLLRLDAPAAVGDADLGVARGLADADRDGLAIAVLDGVGEQVADDLPHAH